jgi:hypothetical protein
MFATQVPTAQLTALTPCCCLHDLGCEALRGCIGHVVAADPHGLGSGAARAVEAQLAGRAGCV